MNLNEASQESIKEKIGDSSIPVSLIAWTTTPWTLPSNTALAVNSSFDYAVVRSFNQYTGKPFLGILAHDLVSKQFSGKYAEAELEEDFDNYEHGAKKIPFKILSTLKGSDLIDLRYHQLLPFVQPMDNPEEAF